MALAISEAKAVTGTVPFTAYDWDLGAPPANTKGLVVWWARGQITTPFAYGGQAMDLVVQGTGPTFGEFRVLELINEDFAAASGTHLTMTSSYGVGWVHAAWLLDDVGLVRVTQGWHSADFQARVTLNPGSREGCLAYCCGATGGTTDASLAVIAGQTEMSHVTHDASGSYREDISTSTVVGYDKDAGGGSYLSAWAVLYASETTLFEPAAFGAEAGFQAGVTLSMESDVNLGVNRFGAEAGLRSDGIVFEIPVARQVPLVGGGKEMPSRTVGGTEGQVLTQHADRQPSWEDPAGATSGIEVAEADGAPDVSGVTRIEFDGATITNDGGGQVTITITPGGIADITDLPTSETDTDLRLAPDGAGGVEWAAGGGSGGAPPALRVYTYSTFR